MNHPLFLYLLLQLSFLKALWDMSKQEDYKLWHQSKKVLGTKIASNYLSKINGIYALGSSEMIQANETALKSIVALLTENMKEFAEEPKEIKILDKNGKEMLAGDNERRFFEASWLHKYNGKYYFSYSTGNTHLICYTTGDTPYTSFSYQEIILKPLIGCTSHHSICQVEGKWYLFYHDSSLSKGIAHLRSIKLTEITYNEDGTIVPINPYRGITNE